MKAHVLTVTATTKSGVELSASLTHDYSKYTVEEWNREAEELKYDMLGTVEYAFREGKNAYLKLGTTVFRVADFCVISVDIE